MKYKERSCSFRLDDITPTMDWSKFYRVKAIFDKHKIKPLVGVVPDNRDEALSTDPPNPEFWELIKRLQDEEWTIALHGLRHVYETNHSGLLGIKEASEFAGLPYDVQLRKIKRGLEIFEEHGIQTSVFMAPGHTFDNNTLKALKNTGFEYVSDGYSNIPFVYGGLTFIPCRSSRPVIAGGVDTVCFHTNEFEEADYILLDTFLEEHADSVRSFSFYMDQMWFPMLNPLIRLQQTLNVNARLIKKNIQQSAACRDYLERTYDEDPAVKRKNRIKALPGLIPEYLKEMSSKKRG